MGRLVSIATVIIVSITSLHAFPVIQCWRAPTSLWSSVMNSGVVLASWCASFSTLLCVPLQVCANTSLRTLHLCRTLSVVCATDIINAFTTSMQIYIGCSIKNKGKGKGKGKDRVLDIALLHDKHMLRSALQSRKWQLIGTSYTAAHYAAIHCPR